MGAKKIDFAAMPRMALWLLISPAESFRVMPKKGGFLEPLVFAGAMGLTASIIQAIWNLLGFGYGGQAPAGVAWILLSIIFMPVILVICSFICAAIVFFIWKLMGSTQNYEVFYRCIAYLMSLAPVISIINVIPYAGIILSFAIVTFYIVVASAEVQGIPFRRALQVFGTIGLIWIIGIGLSMLSLHSEYSARNPTPEQVRKAAEETAKQYQQHIDEARKQAEEVGKQDESKQ
jgi:hypothetical protein